MKKVSKKLLSVLLGVMFLASTLVGCGGKAQDDAKPAETETTTKTAEAAKDESSGSPKKVAFICKSYTDTFCVWVKDEIEKKAVDYKDQFTVDCLDSKNTSSTQIEQIENCVASGYDAIIFQQVDAEAPVEAVKAAVNKGIKVIVTTGSINDFKKVLGETKGVEIVAEEIGEWQKDKAMTIVQNWLVAYPDLSVIMAHNDDMALGAIEAIKMAGKEGKIQVYGIDATAAGCQAIQAGTLGASVFQNAVDYADLALEYASAHFKGEEKESTRIDSELVTPENVADYIEIHKQLGNIK